MPDTLPKSDALRMAEIRDLLPTTLGSAEIRDAIAADIRARSVFVSRAANVVFLSKVQEVVDGVANGEMDKASARVTLLETLRALGYTPEGGFPTDLPGEVPPALQGTLQDLTSFRRLSLIVDTQVAMANGMGQQLRGLSPERMKLFPAYELVRLQPRRAPRNWDYARTKLPPRHHGQPDLRSRWTIAGGTLRAGRMIALKGDPVWGELGASGNFDDALDTDYPPFAFNSGMGWLEVPRAECAALKVTGPDGETIDEWLAGDHPVLTAMPPPVVSLGQAPPALVLKATKGIPATVVGGTMTTPGNAAAVQDRAARRQARLEESIARSKDEYAARGN